MAKQDEELRFSLIDGVSRGIRTIKEGIAGVLETGEKLNQNFELVGKSIEGIKKVGEAFATPVEKAAALEAALRRVGSVTNASADDFKILEKAVLGAAAQFGVPIEEAAAALENLARNGATAAEAAAALAPALALAKAAGIGATEAASILGDALDQFGLKGKDAGLVADVLAKAANAAGVGVAAMAESFKAAAPAAARTGADLRDTAATVGLLAEAGVESGKAGETLNQVFGQLADSGSKLRDALHGAGTDTRSFGDLIAILSKDGALASRVYSDLGPTVGPILAAAVRQGSGAFKDLRANLTATEGAAAALARQATAGLIGAFDRLKVAIDVIEIASGKPLLKPLADNLDLLTEKLTAFSNSPEFEKVATALTELFDNAGAALRQYITDFDFDEVKARLTDFADNAKLYFAQVGAYAQAGADGVVVAFQGIRAIFDTLDVTVSLLVGSIAKLNAILLTPFAKLDDQAANIKQTLEDLADNAFTRAAAAGEGLGKATASIGDHMDSATAAIKRAAEASAKVTASTTNAGNAAGAAAPKVGELVDAFGKVAPAADEATRAAEENAKANAKAADENERAAEAAAKTAQASRDYETALNRAEIAATKAAAAYAEMQRDANATPEALAKAREEFIRSGKALEDLRNHQHATTTQSDDLKKAFAELGITGAQGLAEKVNKASQALDKIAESQKTGAKNTHDLQAAYDAYAAAVHAAAAVAEPAQAAELERQLAVKGATLGVTESLKQMGQAGATAGDQLTTASKDAAAALEHVATAADDAGGSVEDFAAATTRAADATAEANAQMSDASTSITGVSEKFAEDAARLNTLARSTFFIENFNRLADMYARQTNELNRQVEALKKQNQQYDDMAKRVDALHKQFRTLGDEQLRALAEQQQRLEDSKKRAEEELKRQRDELDRQRQEVQQQAAQAQTGTVSKGAGLGGGSPQNITINIHGVLSTDKDEFARQIAPAIQKAIKDRGFLSR